MRTRKRPKSIGLSMLDLISNSLASLIILFIILSSLRTPQVPPETFLGTVFIEYRATFYPPHSDSLPEIALWLQPLLSNEKYNQLLEDSLGSMSFIWNEYTSPFNAKIIDLQNNDTLSDKLLHADPNLDITRVAFYEKVDSPNVCYLVLRNPPVGTYENGLLFTDNPELKNGVRAIKVQRRVKITQGKDSKINDTTATVDAPTDYVKFFDFELKNRTAK